ncbi:electron transfer flavoprotein subunit beta/FixA family protein [Thiococcus pfennigii]|uniref:electron transfer flavoprotein subunit beta/FixA family protein n=1 Tax=Thiococcus pfennigii TaxID=1057 RepID=UPI0019038D70|nr:electron transfer flavoprotein subunit beta/FixA family protein [Thiococcus pfennigii]MBK1700106.1 electron transfer flavoprotein subunit beta [Thiococcus pfennigii]MBK1731870.1 electron transfer flavoprotein subunit beta [Thiococcus pfennigii]
MHAVVAIKQVPDTTNVRIDPDTGTLIREGVPAIVNPYDVHALEMAVRLKERFGGQVTVLTMGPPKAAEALIECVEQGADRAILLSDRKFGGADTLATSYVLAGAIEAIRAEGPVDLLLFGKQAIDGDTAQVGPGVATRLGVPLITYAIEIEAFDPLARTAIVHRRTELGVEVLETALPALLTVEKEIAAIARAPLPNLVRAARYRPEVWDAAQPVAFDAAKLGIKGSPTVVGRAFTPAAKAPGEQIEVAALGLPAVIERALTRLEAAGVLAAGPPSAGGPGGGP